MDELVKWLRDVLDAAERREHERYSDDDGYLYEPDPAVLARITAERFIVELHEGSHECSSWNSAHGEYDSCCWVVDDPCSTVVALAWGHRFDAPGWRDEWAPAEVTTAAG